MESKRRRLQYSRLYKSTVKSLEKMTSDTATLDSSDSDDTSYKASRITARVINLENTEDDTNSHEQS